MKHSDAQKLLELGLITPEQQAAIIEKLNLTPKAASRNYLMIAFSCLGGLLVLAGIILLISANWEAIPDLVKQISGAALMLGFWAAGLKFILGKNPRPFIGESLCLVGAGMWLANIGLYGQIYQISSEPSKAIGVWFLGIFLLPWLVRLRGVFVMSAFAGFLWIVSKMNEMELYGDDPFYVVLAYFFGLSALGIFISSLKEETRERFRGYGPLAAWTALPIAVLMAQVFCYDVVCCDSLLAPIAGVLAPVLFTTALVVDVRSRARGNFGAYLAAVFLGIFPFVVLVLGILDNADVPEDILQTVMMAVLFAEGIVAMILGSVVLRKFYVNIGALMVLLSAFAVMAEVVGSLTESGFTLIIAGTFLLVFGYFLERSRRKITAKIKERELTETSMNRGSDERGWTKDER